MACLTPLLTRGVGLGGFSKAALMPLEGLLHLWEGPWAFGRHSGRHRRGSRAQSGQRSRVPTRVLSLESGLGLGGATVPLDAQEMGLQSQTSRRGRGSPSQASGTRGAGTLLEHAPDGG